MTASNETQPFLSHEPKIRLRQLQSRIPLKEEST